MPLTEGDIFAGYTIVRRLGAGGMGEVYLAQHPRLPRLDALKVLPAALTTDTGFRQRFNREAELAAKLWHPHIVGLHDRGEYEGQLWISMDYVEGNDASQLLATHFPSGMPESHALAIIDAVAGALDYAHQQGLLHRDVKPANILISKLGTEYQRILLSDFGIARQMDDISGLTATNAAVGTISYAAPEQLLGKTIDGRADQYALACTAFDLLTGSRPFSGSNPAVVIGQHVAAPPPSVRDRRPDLGRLDPVFQTALAKRPEDRFVRCTDFAAALAHQLREPSFQSQPTAAAPAFYPHPPDRRSGSRTTMAVAGILAVVVVVGVAILVALLLRDKPADTDASETTTAGKPDAVETTSRRATTTRPSPTTVPAANPRVTIDGKPQSVSGKVVCTTLGEVVNIAVGDAVAGIGVVVTVGDSPQVTSVGLGNFDGVTLGYTAGSGQGDAQATKEGKTYTIVGTATGVDMANPMQPVSKPFAIQLTCP